MSRVLIHGMHLDGQSSKIKGLQASLLKPEEILRLSVQEIGPCQPSESSGVVLKNTTSKPKTILAQLNSTTLGTVDYREYCQTCRNLNTICPSHGSHHYLEWPVIHIGFIPDVIKLLQHVCYFCAKLIQHDDSILPPLQERNHIWCKQQWQKIHRSMVKYKTRICSHCDMPQPRYSTAFDLIKVQWTALCQDFPNEDIIKNYENAKRHALIHQHDLEEDMITQWFYRSRSVIEPETRLQFTSKPFTPRDVEWMFERLDDESIWRLGRNPQLNHPKWMIWNSVPIAGRIVHPSVSESNGSTSKGTDGITTQYKTMISKNIELREWKLKFLKQQFGSAYCPEALRWWHCCDSRGPLEYPHDLILLIAAMHTEVSCLIDRKPVKQEIHHSGRTGAKNLKNQSSQTDQDEENPSKQKQQTETSSKKKKRKRADSHGEATSGSGNQPFNPLMRQVDICTNKVGLVAPPVSKFKKKQPKTLAEQNNGKSGNFRGHVSGKRADKTDRAVIVSDASLALHEVGVPEPTIINQTYPRRVNDRNRDYLLKRICKGPNVPEGAKLIVTDEGSEIWLESLTRCPDYLKPNYLQNGWIVHLHLDESQWSIANRQPSLHKGSMMAHKIRRKSGKAMGINDNVSTPYNADFDGDEMNLTHPQSMHARATAQMLMAVHTHMICPKSHRLIIGLKQDVLLGSFLMTDRNTFLDEDQVKTLIHSLEIQFGMLIRSIPDPAILLPKRLWTGKQIWSMVIPKSIHYTKALQGLMLHDDQPIDACIMDETQRLVHIYDGELISGKITNAIIGISQQTVIQQLWRYIGKAEACRIASKLTWIVHAYLQCRGFTLGADDVVLGMDHASQASMIKRQLNDHIDRLYEYAGYQCLEFPIHESQYIEAQANLLKIVKQSNEYMQRLVVHAASGRPTLLDLMESGSKGSINHMTQISASVGLQQRNQIPIGLIQTVDTLLSSQYMARLVPNHWPGERSAQSLGLIKSSFSEGLSPEESFKHCMISWPTIYEAAKPEKAGYLQRKLSKMSEGCTVQYDGTVRDENANIIQLVYGGDGTESTLITQSFLSPHMISNPQYMHHPDNKIQAMNLPDIFTHYYQVETWMLKYVTHNSSICSACQQESLVCGELIEMLLSDHADLYCFDYKTKTMLKKQGFSVYMPIDVPTIIERHAFEWKKKWSSSFTLPATEEDLYACWNQNDYDHLDYWKDVVHFTQAIHHHGSPFIQKQSLLFVLHHHFKYMNPRYQFWKAQKNDIHSLLTHMYHEYVQSFCDPGEPVGPIACQSISEPSTQLILRASTKIDTHDIKQLQHLSAGLPRLEEIYGFNPTKCPSLTAVLNPQWIKTENQAKFLAQQWIGKTLGDCIDDSKTLWIDTHMDRYTPINDASLKNAVTMDGQILPHHPMYQAILESIRSSYVDMEYDCPRFHIFMITAWKPSLLEQMSIHAWQAQLKLGLLSYQHSTWINGHWMMWMHVNPQVSSHWVESTPINTQPSQSFFTHYQYCNKLLVQLCQNWILMGLKQIQKLSGVFFDSERKRFMVYLIGNELGQIMSHPATISHACTTSDLHEIKRIFGQDAANQATSFETHMVLCGDGSTYVQPRHTSLMADIMFMEGKVNRMNRSGLDQREGLDFTVKMSFEKTAKHMVESGIYAQVDRLTGMTANIMFGTPSPYAGTGITGVYAPDHTDKSYHHQQTCRDYTASRPQIDIQQSMREYINATLD